MTMTIGQLINELECVDPTLPVRYDFCGCIPTTIASWRGSYALPALGWRESGGDSLTAGALLLELEEAVSGKVYEGYKGGEYEFRGRDDLWIDNYGRYTETELRSVSVNDFEVVLNTGRGSY